LSGWPDFFNPVRKTDKHIEEIFICTCFFYAGGPAVCPGYPENLLSFRQYMRESMDGWFAEVSNRLWR
jgi:hypothetical protein